VGLTNLGSESETCVGSHVHLVGVSISFEKNFYRLPFTPPSLVRRIGPSNSPKRKTLRTSFFFFKLPLKFSDQRRKSKRSNSGENRGRRPPGPTWAGRPRPAGPPCLRGRVGLVFRAPPFFHLLSPWEKVGPVDLREKLQKTKRKTIYRNSCLVFRPRQDVRALLPW
jgi:hypothetical protein